MRLSVVIGAGLVAVLSLLALIGWYSGLTPLTIRVPLSESMVPHTARALLVLAVAVVVLPHRTATLILGSLVVLISLTALVGHAVGSAVAADSWLLALFTPLSADRVTTPISPITALCLLVLGSAVLLSRRQRPTLMLAAASVSLCVSQVAVLGYAYGVSSLQTVGGATSMAPLTAVSLGILAVAIHLSRPADGLVGLLHDTGSAGTLARPAVLFCLLGPFALGLFSVAGQGQGWFDAGFGAGIVVMSVTIVGCAVSWVAAVRLRDLDRDRDTTARALQRVNATLTSTVHERTGELAESAGSLEALLRVAPVAIVQLDADGGLVTANELWYALCGLSPEDSVGDGWKISIHPDDRNRVFSGWAASVRDATSFVSIHRLRTPAGKVSWVQVNTTPIREARSSLGEDLRRIRGHLASVTDITELRAAQEAGSAARAMFETAFSSSPLGTAIVNRSGLIVEANRRLLEFVGPNRTLIGRPWESVFLPAGPTQPEQDGAAASSSLLSEAGHHPLPDRQMLRSDSQQIWVRVSAASIADGNDNSGMLYQLEDITFRRAAEARVEHLALHDPLTNLPNRLLLLDRLGLELLNAQRSGYGVGVLFLDLDRFKAVNDALGHHAGDTVLCQVADRLRTSARSSDTVSRLGGDEFVVVCPNVKAGHDLGLIANKIRAAVIEPIHIGAETVTVGVSIGVARGKGQENPETLLKLADRAMYRMKQSGRAVSNGTGRSGLKLRD